MATAWCCPMPNRTLLWIGAGIGLVLVVSAVLAARKAAATVGNAANAINPLNPENIFYGGVNAAGAAITGDSDFSLGGQIAEWFSPAVAAANASLSTSPAAAPAPLDLPYNGIDTEDADLGY